MSYNYIHLSKKITFFISIGEELRRDGADTENHL